MAVERYYLTPWVAPLYSLGGGVIVAVDPGTAVRTFTQGGPRVLLHGVWQTNVTGHYLENVIPTGLRGRAKGYCLAFVRAPDTDPLNLHALIQADSQIALVPWQPDNLDALFGSLAAQTQTKVRNALETAAMNSQWITAATPFRSIMAYILSLTFCGQQLGTDYPEGPLTTRWNALGASTRSAVSAYLTTFGLPAISGNPTRREVIDRLALADYGRDNPRLGGVQFGPWSP